MKDVIANEKLPYIPETFILGCHTFKVQLYEELYDDNDPLYGQFDYDEQIIMVSLYPKNVFLTHIIMSFSTPLTICGILEARNRLLVLLQC